MQTKYDIMSYRQDLRGFGEPKDGSWDGFQRINTELKTGGIIGVFRDGAVESRRLATIYGLDPTKSYEVKSMDGTSVFSGSGTQLQTKGIELKINEMYGGQLFEVSLK
jgi:alpha-galactosidase